mmetsp:Transcript_42640/g.100002  ORF Transcript_42640/g.100002 Transcript_42640/m.100002 type:complete len:82 (-) Transcript_42640:816-1061(-)
MIRKGMQRCRTQLSIFTVVALLHNMKQRNDAWGRRSSHAGNAVQENGSSDHFNLYTFVVGEVQEQYFLSEWRCLDIVGLGL